MKLRCQTVYCFATFLLLMAFFCEALPRQQFDASSQIQQCFNSPLAKSANDFGASLIASLEGASNVFISPFSIYAALAMTYLGAEGQTAREIEQAFLFPDNGIEGTYFHQSFLNTLKSIKSRNNEYNLYLANAIFAQQDFKLESRYLDDVKKFYHAMVKMVDFATASRAAKDEINKFVSKSTHNMIDEFLKEPLNQNTVLALINAIYFKGTWKIQFPTKATIEGTFRKGPSLTKKVKYMRLDGEKFRFFEDSDNQYKFLELPYNGGDISMLLAMPKSHEQLPNLQMNSEFLCNINKSLSLTKLGKIWLPKFQLRYTKELVNELKQLGIRDLFSNAELTGIRTEGDLSVSTVLHEAVINVNEEGSEASAATGIITGKMLPLIPPPEFVADHSFAFYIIDHRSGLILFSGRLFDP